MNMPGMVFRPKEVEAMLLASPKDGAAADQVAGGVMAHQASNRYGP